MKRTLWFLCVLAALLTAVLPAAMAQEPQYYPTDVTEFMEGENRRIKKIYQLSPADDAGLIPTEGFERDGRRYEMLDITKQEGVGIDTKEHAENVTLETKTDNMTEILKLLAPEKDVITDDGYTGVIRLDHTSIEVKAAGYTTGSRGHSVTRTYPNLSEADVSLIPKTVTDGGLTLSLADVSWSESATSGAEGLETHYTATAKYTGSSYYQTATGYTVNAVYRGEVARAGCDVVTYIVLFGCVEPEPEETEEPPAEEAEEPEEPAPAEDDPADSEEDPAEDEEAGSSGLPVRTIAAVAFVVLLVVLGFFLFHKIKGRM